MLVKWQVVHTLQDPCKLAILSGLQIFILALGDKNLSNTNSYLKCVGYLVIGLQNCSFVLLLVICRPLIKFTL